MGVVLKILKIGGLIFSLLLAALIVIIFFTGPELPGNSDQIVREVIHSGPPELVRGDSGTIVSDGHKIWYESVRPAGKRKGTILLFMGMASDALMWPQSFIDKLSAAGYQVIRFDYRGVGQSDRVADWKRSPYTLADLAKDARAVIDNLKVTKVHLVGFSMGGMVAQEFAIRYPQNTVSMVNLMSSGYIHDPALPRTSGMVAAKFLKIGIKYGLIPGEANMIRMMLASKIILRGNANYKIDVRNTANQVLYNLRRRNGYNPDVSAQHDMAVRLSGSRYARLKELRIPTLIIHGRNDPLAPIAHSEKLASIIPNARSEWIDNMGHDLPFGLVEPVGNMILRFISGNSKR